MTVIRKLTHHEITTRRVPRQDIGAVVRTPIIGLLDNIRSLYNVGSIFRTSDGARAEALFLAGYTPRPPRKEIEKTALGATQTVPWQYFTDPLEAALEARRRGARICILEHTTGSTPYYSVRKEDFPLCLVVGNELTGVSGALVGQADMAIEIPMIGVKQSLNAAVAYGIALFELLRIWQGK
jgi:tRNA G18 (ribose-2'-O)-methylase SpoU